jgi:RHS repeat-associated protein
VTAARTWTPYGVELGGAQAGLGYAGEWWDAGLEMQYLRARWYAPYLSQFVRQDPMGPDYRNPQSINGYTYALGNPVRYTDPKGLAPQPSSLYPCSTVDEDTYNLTDWLVREMHYQSNHWPVQWGISLLNEIGRHYDPTSGGLVDSVVFSLAKNLRTYIPWNWDEHSYRNDIATLAYTGSSLWWAGMVKDGARWDFKDQINREFYPVYNPKGGIMLCDVVEECRWYEYSMPGNIFYGYVGRAAGFGEWDLRAGAFYAQQMDPENDPELNDWFLGLDQAGDQAALELGFMMYNLTQGASDEVTVRYAFKTALLIHKDRLAVGQIPTEPYVLPPRIPIGPDGPEFPLQYFDGTNCMGWMGE